MVKLLAKTTVGVLAAALLGCTSRPTAPPSTPSQATSPLHFTEVTTAAGIDYRFEVAGTRPLHILQTIGNGCALFDFDNDGNLDILLVGAHPALFKGDGKGHFSPATALLPTELPKTLIGVAVGDYNNDGFADIYLSGYRTGVLLQNEGGRRFIDVTKQAGLVAQPWGTSASWAELRPNSGKLDLVVGNYAVFGADLGTEVLCTEPGADGKPVQTSCAPRLYKPLKPTLFTNQGSGKFTAASLTAATGRTLGVAVATIDSSGTPRIALANDEIEGDLLQAKGATYENIAARAGTNVDRDGNIHGGMGTDWGDYDNDGLLDLVVATFTGEGKSLYHNEGSGTFLDLSYPSGIGAPAQPYVAFGTRFFDADNDGWLDLVFANGHVQDNITAINATTSYHQPSLLLHNLGTQGKRATFADVTKTSGEGFLKPIVGRGLATGDYDNDGKIDLLIIDSEGTPLLLHNESPTKSHWLGLKLVGTKSNKDGYGAIVTLTTGKKTIVRHCHADGSYLSSSDPRVHVGLGESATINTVTVRWPSGKTERFTPQVDRYTTLTEGTGS